MSSVKLLSPAKVNLFLRVLGKRPDGYHELQSIAQPVSLFDEISLSVEPGEGSSLSCSGREMPSGNDNLAVAACHLYLGEAGVRKKVSIGIKKNIPIGAGLGGGSSNAATVLVGLNRVLGKFTDRDLLRMAASLGADVPFFVRSTSSFIEGVGERVEMLSDFPLFHYVILFPRKSLSTREVYENWERPEPPPEKVDPVSLAERFRGVDFPLENGLEAAVFAVFPEILSLKEIFRSLGARFVLVSGSGSSVFSVFPRRQEAEEIHEYLGTSSEFDVFLAGGISGWHFLAD
ncbi:MAG: 4-(cytidine 5'-diphospho)-2-C-methyl-D-erythritol kinase [Candidatus Dadabacteria bacterium]|nr:4-(cytidine 5'-diphospho)-2-C-methyl-D-erythritol kinase [Candidatus Dadabacteria bacterium]MDE0477871.1 4-(cytidine 5'-diphospho)-2-C-methyl-D-erythritol kinase [Candidatus Dadabacteria bacterium]